MAKKENKLDAIEDALRAQQQVSGQNTLDSFLLDEDKLTQVEAGYTTKQGAKGQECRNCRKFEPNGRDWGDCNKVAGAVHVLAHCRYLVVRR